jgi:hypothetical protein
LTSSPTNGHVDEVIRRLRAGDGCDNIADWLNGRPELRRYIESEPQNLSLLEVVERVENLYNGNNTPEQEHDMVPCHQWTSDLWLSFCSNLVCRTLLPLPEHSCTSHGRLHVGQEQSLSYLLLATWSWYRRFKYRAHRLGTSIARFYWPKLRYTSSAQLSTEIMDIGGANKSCQTQDSLKKSCGNRRLTGRSRRCAAF